MRRGEVWLADLDPAFGAEAKKTRPVVIVSRDGSNQVVERQRYGVATVVPLTSNVNRVFDFQAKIFPSAENGIEKDSKAQAEQIRALVYQRFVKRMGILSRQEMAAVDEALLIHLDLY